MKIKKLLTSTLLLSLSATIVAGVSSCSTVNKTEQADKTQHDTNNEPLTVQYTTVKFKARSSQTGIEWTGNTSVRAKVGRQFSTIQKPVARLNGYVVSSWELENGTKIKDTDLITAGLVAYPVFDQDIALKDCIGLQAIQESTVSIVTHGSLAAPNILYSKTGIWWDEYKNGQILTIHSGEVMYFKGDNSSGFSHSDSNYTTFSIGGAVSLTGNVMTLLDNGSKDEPIESIPCSYCFYKLFENCSGIVSISSNLLPSEHLKDHSYAYMFSNCRNLTVFPSSLLPDTQLNDNDGVYTGTYCYAGMFMNCSGLTTIPTTLLPAGKPDATHLDNNLSGGCYYGMFAGCTGLTYLQDGMLPATSLATGCYAGMFSGCTRLEDINVSFLPASNLKESCYASMFSQCTSLTDASELNLPAMDLTGAPSCYEQMFYNCTSLEKAPVLPATTLSTSCYNGMFYNCEQLTDDGLPDLGTPTLAPSCYRYMFFNCYSLTKIPDLKTVNLSTSGATYCYANMFEGCRGLVNLSDAAIAATTLSQGSYHRMFARCISLTTAPAIKATTLAANCCYQMFFECKALTASPELSATSSAEYCYYQMFMECVNLSAAGTIGLTNLTTRACYMMFANCSNLYLTSTTTRTVAHAFWTVPSTGYTDGAVHNMFQGTSGTEEPITPSSGATCNYYTVPSP